MRLDPGWLLLLRQIGLPVAEINWDRLAPETFGVLVLNAPIDNRHRAGIEDYLRGGGAVLDTQNFLRKVDGGGHFIHRYFDSIIPRQDEAEFDHIGIIDMHRVIRTHRQARHVNRTIWLGERFGGAVAHVPYNIAGLMIDDDRARRMFPAPARRYPDELVARITKGELRRIIDTAIGWLYRQRGIPRPHLSPLPDPARNIFCYRIDSDYGTRRQIETLARTAGEHHVPLSWFIHVEPQRELLDVFKSFDGHELGLHAWRHRTFDSFDENHANIQAAWQTLQDAGITPRSYASPTGKWNLPLARVLEEYGFDYSSEFGLDYDNLPSYPWMGSRFSTVLQVPVHPVSIGNLMRVKATSDEMIHYYRGVIDRKVALGEPAMLYHHPGHEHWDVVSAIFEHAKLRGLHNTLMGDYARWWKRRDAVRFTAAIDGDRLTITGNNLPDEMPVMVTHPDGRVGTLHGAGSWSMGDVTWKQPAETPELPVYDLYRARRFSATVLRHSIEDFNATVAQ